MPKIVEVPGVGNIEFPDTMGDDEIGAAIAKTNFKPQSTVGDTLKSAWRSFAHGVVPFDAQIVGAGNAVQGKFEGDQRPFTDIYADERDKRRAQMQADREQHPAVSLIGDVAGTMAGPAKLLPGATLKKALAGGAALGAVRSAAEGQDLPDIAKGTAAGAVGAGGGFLLGKALSPAAQAIADKLRGGAIDNARKVLMGGAQSISRKLPVSADAAQEALDSSILPFGTTKGTAARLRGELERSGDQYSQIVDGLESAGVAGPDSTALANQIAAAGKKVDSNTLAREVPTVYSQVAEDLPKKATGPIPLSQAEALKRSLQHRAQYDRTVPTDVNDARTEVAAIMRKANEDAIAAGAPAAGPQAQDLANQFVPVKQQYGRLAEAMRAADQGVAQAGRRSGPNLTDTITGSAMAAAHGVPAGLAAKFLSAVWRARGPSTKAWLQNALANGVEPMAAQLPAADSTRPAIAEILRRALLPAPAVPPQPGVQPVPQ